MRIWSATKFLGLRISYDGFLCIIITVTYFYKTVEEKHLTKNIRKSFKSGRYLYVQGYKEIIGCKNIKHKITYIHKICIWIFPRFFATRLEQMTELLS